MSGSFESGQWNACVHRLDLGLYSHPKGFNRMESTHVNSKRKIPSTGGSEEGGTQDASRRTVSPTNYQLSHSGAPSKNELVDRMSTLLTN